MRRVILVAFILFIVLSMQVSAEECPYSEQVRDGVFVHISSNNPHRVLMALQMAKIMSEDKDVMIYIDIKGVEIALKDSPDIEYGEFPSSHTQFKALLEKGVYICVCPGCLKDAGKTAEDVMDGIKIAEKDKFFSFTKGRILTITY